ncbi:MAG: hypothetical protein FJY98_03175 [Candidatus Liptonbacteria bacterium]|nr:hypothetical protein [Candidatus Liptonbacteria bacterium]
MIFSLIETAKSERRQPTGNEKEQFRRQLRDMEDRYMAGGMVPGKGLTATLQKISEGWVLNEAGIAVPERQPTELFLDKPIQHAHLQFISEFEAEIPVDATLDSTPRTAYCPGGWNSNITDSNFRTSLVPGKKYMAEVYWLRRNKSSESLVKIADEQKRILPGALGGAILTSRYGDKLPKDFWVVCLDKPENLWRGAGVLLVPFFRWDGIGWNFFLSFWLGVWDQGFYIVLFREVSNP